MIAKAFQTPTRRAKVLHVITHLGVGGALDNTLLTVERLPRDTYQVDLAAGQLSPEEGYKSCEDRSRQGSDNLHFIPNLQRAVHPIADLRACQELTQLMRRERYDIVHTHCAKAGVVGRIAARRAGVPIVLHTCHAFGNQVVRERRGHVVKRVSGYAKSRLFTGLERYAGSLSDRVITVCEQNRQQAIDQQLATAEKVVTVYSGIDLDQFDRRGDRNLLCHEHSLDPSRPLIGFIGRLCEQKSPLDFVAAAKQVSRVRPDAQFLIAGDGPLAKQVDDACRDEPNIHPIGFSQRVPELMSILDVLAVSSLWEGLGRSVTEAMIVGVPVAATAVDGIPELVEHERTGLLSPPRSPDRLADNIIHLLNEPETAKRIAQEARRRVVPAFGADRMLERIDQLYRELCDEKHGDSDLD
ncbi:MAG: glycosyltransferase family 4 protein, partial [Planctomycetota bacterium]